MITDEIVEAIDTMISLCSEYNQALGMASIREMLCDLDVDTWVSMSKDNRKDWLVGFLSCVPNNV